MTTTRRRIATALIAVATLGGVGLSTAAPAAATSYRTVVGGPWSSFANCRNYIAIKAQTNPGSYGFCSNTTYQGTSGIFSIINFPLRSKG